MKLLHAILLAWCILWAGAARAEEVLPVRGFEFNKIGVSSPTLKQVVALPTNQFVVVKDTAMWTLDDFVKSGKWCEWRGKHDWNVEFSNSDPAYKSPTCKKNGIEIYKGARHDTCIICNKCRALIKKKKEVIEWED